jgi:hypothetical protein
LLYIEKERKQIRHQQAAVDDEIGEAGVDQTADHGGQKRQELQELSGWESAAGSQKGQRGGDDHRLVGGMA